MLQQTDKNEKPRLLSGIARNPYIRFILFGIVICMLPVLTKAGLVKSSYITNIGGVLIYAIAALGLNLLLGYSGLISLGTAGFMGLGSYIAAYITRDLGLPFFVAILFTILIPLVIGILVGLVSLRISGLYLAIATLCVSEILRKTFEELNEFTGGFSDTRPTIPPSSALRSTGKKPMFFWRFCWCSS
jgi:branched-chain amino acid transport system permease protein